MNNSLFSENIIALIWDFDKTLIPGNMQEPLFKEYGVNASAFWEEVNEKQKLYKDSGYEMTSNEAFYLNHILDYVKNGKFAGLNNTKLRELGGTLEFCNGMPDFFQRLNSTIESEHKECRIRLEHYVVSSGLRQMILGSKVAKYLNGVWGCELLGDEPDPDRPLSRIGYLLDHTTKTRAVFEINKGANVLAKLDVNARISEGKRRVPIAQMIYIADGPSDVPIFSVIKHYEGKNFAVYVPDSEQKYKQAYDLFMKEERVHGIGPADFSEGSATYKWLHQTIRNIAESIAERHRRLVADQTGNPPQHFQEKRNI